MTVMIRMVDKKLKVMKNKNITRLFKNYTKFFWLYFKGYLIVYFAVLLLGGVGSQLAFNKCFYSLLLFPTHLQRQIAKTEKTLIKRTFFCPLKPPKKQAVRHAPQVQVFYFRFAQSLPTAIALILRAGSWSYLIIRFAQLIGS